MKIKNPLLPLAACIALSACAAFSGCGARGYLYDNANTYSVGNAVITDAVTELDVDWVGGNVEISYEEREGISISETSEKKFSSSQTMRYSVEQGKLKIKYAKSGATNLKSLSKTLKIVLPAVDALKYCEVETEAASVTVTGIKCRDFIFESVSGDIDFTGAALHEFEAETVSGNVKANFSTLYYVSPFYAVDVETVSGDVELIIGAEMPVALKFGTVSGTHDWSGFDVVPSTNGMYNINGGGKPVTVNTVSGSFKLTKAS